MAVTATTLAIAAANGETERTAEAAQTRMATEPMTYVAAGDEREIAKVAYQLWLDRGCPHGSDQEDWFRAEEMLKGQ